MKIPSLLMLAAVTISLTGCGESGAITGSQLACLTGTWKQNMTDLQAQYSQLLPPNLTATVKSGSSTFTFNPDHTFVQQINNLSVQTGLNKTAETNRAMDMNMVITMNGSITGQYNADTDGTVYFDNINSSGLTSNASLNGQPMMNNQSMGLLPNVRTNVSDTCAGTDLTLNYLINGKTISLHLSR